MPASDRNRGKQANDDKLFGTPKMQSKIRDAVQDMSFLLGRGYAEKSSLQLVGNRYKLNARQQKAVLGMSASAQQLAERRQKQVHNLRDGRVLIDGFNLIIILESALSGAYLFKGLDGCYRDVSSVHGTYKRVRQTEEVLTLIGDSLQTLGAKDTFWYLDSPVSNSGRLKVMMLELAEKNDYNWNVELVFNPDKVLAGSNEIAISSDGWILDETTQWFNLGAYIIENRLDRDKGLILEAKES